MRGDAAPPAAGPSWTPVRRSLLVAVVPASAVVGGVVALAVAVGESPGDLLREATTVAGVEPWIGGLSAFTVLLWSAVVAVALFGGVTAGSGRPLGAPLVQLGAVALVLGLDDQYQLHEDVLPRLGVPQELVVLGEGLALLAVLVVHRRLLLPRREVGVLALALLLLGSSVLVDVLAELVPGLPVGPRLLAEDLAKTAGVAALLHYVWLLAADAVRHG